MTTTWVGPNAYHKLRSELKRTAIALAKARHEATGAPVMVSLELEYFGFKSYGDPSIHRQDEYNDFIRMIDETRPRRPRKGDGRATQGGSNSPVGPGMRPPKTRKPVPAILRRADSNIPQGWFIAS
jgi:hypothetical protein